jgi:hypothetical protein
MHAYKDDVVPLACTISTDAGAVILIIAGTARVYRDDNGFPLVDLSALGLDMNPYARRGISEIDAIKFCGWS